MSKPVGEVAIAIRSVAAMARIVLPFTCALGQALRRLITPVYIVKLLAPVASLIVRAASVVVRAAGIVVRILVLIVPILVITTVIVIVVIDFGIPVAPIVTTPIVARSGPDSIAKVGVIVARARPRVARVI